MPRSLERLDAPERSIACAGATGRLSLERGVWILRSPPGLRVGRRSPLSGFVRMTFAGFAQNRRIRPSRGRRLANIGRAAR
jgi:hypothetical protein